MGVCTTVRSTGARIKCLYCVSYPDGIRQGALHMVCIDVCKAWCYFSFRMEFYWAISMRAVPTSLGVIGPTYHSAHRRDSPG